MALYFYFINFLSETAQVDKIHVFNKSNNFLIVGNIDGKFKYITSLALFPLKRK